MFHEAVSDLSFLLSKDYGEKSATQLVGNRYRLNARQQKALGRMAVAESAVSSRQAKACAFADLQDQAVVIDGFNLLILLEGALSGAYLFKGMDGVYRDIAGVHGSYKRVQKTEAVIDLIGATLTKFGVTKVHWFLDKPVSNSGRLKVRLLEKAAAAGYDWSVELAFNPDKAVAEHGAISISGDGWVIDHADAWFNLVAILLEKGRIQPLPPIITAF
ncbi:MAG: DUF434 domain-containing protein [Saprospiraceae bacterium]